MKWLAFFTLATLGCGSAVAAGPREIAVGPHRATADHAPLLASFLQNEINHAAFGKPVDLADFIFMHPVTLTNGITEFVPDMKAVLKKYDMLMVAAGLFVESESAFRSTVVMRPVSTDFSVEVARVDTLATTAGTVGPTLAQLLLFYVMIRDARESGLDPGLVAQFVTQACEIAKTVQIKSTDQEEINVAQAIEGDLKKLVRC